MDSIIDLWYNSEKEKYSPDLIDQLDEYENELLPIARKNMKRKEKKIPSRMIINHFTKSYPRPKFMLGPYKLEYFVGDTPNGKLRIYNLYDFHDYIFKTNDEQMFVSNWIYKVLKNSDVFIDVFLEHNVPDRYEEIISLEYGDYLDLGELAEFAASMNDCIFFKENCPAPNCRIHGADIRRNKYIAESFKNIVNDNEGTELTESTVNSLRRKMVKVIKSAKFKKQYRNVPECIQNVLNNIIKKRFRAAIRQLKKFEIDEIKNGDAFNLTLGPILMDAYLISRLFRKFDLRPSDKGMPENIQNAIIYTGGYHAKFYSEVLQQCGFELKFSTGYSYLDMLKSDQQEIKKMRILDISNIPYPLFRD